MCSAIDDEGGQFDENNPNPSFPTIEYSDKRIPSKERVFGGMINDDKVAYTVNYLINNNNVAVDTVGGKVVTIKYFPEYEFVDVFYGDDVNVNHYGNSCGGYPGIWRPLDFLRKCHAVGTNHYICYRCPVLWGHSFSLPEKNGKGV